MSRPSLTKVKDWIAQTGSGSLTAVEVEIDELSDSLDEHVEDTTNPHEVSGSQVGLAAHKANHSNPHVVTAAQLGIASDYAGIHYDGAPATVTIDLQDVYHLVDVFNEDGQDAESSSDSANNRLVLGATRIYGMWLSISGEVNGGGAEFEFEVMQIDQNTVAITDITQANPGVVTAVGHGRANGDKVKLTGVGGMTEVNDRVYVVANKTDDTFELTDYEGVDVNTGGYGAYTAGGMVAHATEVAEIDHDFPNGSIGSSATSFLFSGIEGNALEVYAKNVDNANDFVLSEVHFWTAGL